MLQPFIFFTAKGVHSASTNNNFVAPAERLGAILLVNMECNLGNVACKTADVSIMPNAT
jgi:hypothetical protein